MRPIATTRDAAPRATPKSASVETVPRRPPLRPERNRRARKSGTFMKAGPSSSGASNTDPLRSHQRRVLVEEGVRVVRAGCRLRVVLHREDGAVVQAEALT